MDEGQNQLPDTINPFNFPAKLWRLVNNPSISAICWDSSGEAVVIEQQLFEQLVLSPGFAENDNTCNSFKTSQFSSFVRQLNLYGFKKVVSDIAVPLQGSVIHQYHNSNFKRNNPALLVKLKRRVARNKPKLPNNGIEEKTRPTGSFSFGRRHKDSPHPYRKLPVAPPSGTPVTPHRQSPLDQPAPAWLLSSPIHEAVLLGHGVNVGVPSFTSVPAQNEDQHPGFYPRGYSPALLALPPQPIVFFPTLYPLDLSREAQSPDSWHTFKQEANVNLDSVFQIAKEVMQTQPNKYLVKIDFPKKPMPSNKRKVMGPTLAFAEDSKEELDHPGRTEGRNTSWRESSQD